MNSQARLRQIFSFSILIIFTLVFGLARGAQAQGGVALTSDGSNGLDDNNSPVRALATMDKIPLIHEEVRIACELTSFIAAPGTTAQVELPDTAKVVSGDANWTGDLTPGKPVTFGVTAVFTAEGDTQIFCRVHYQVDDKNSFGDLAAIYLSIGQVRSLEGYAPVPANAQVILGEQLAAGQGTAVAETEQNRPLNNADHTAPAPPSLDPAEESSSAVIRTAPEAVDALTITGHWYYYDRDDTLTPVLEQLVEIQNGNNGAHLAWCYTGLDGSFSCGPFTNPGSDGVRGFIHTYTSYNPNPDLLIVKSPDFSGTNPNVSYRAQSSIQTFSDGTFDLGSWAVPNGSTYERAYWAQRDLNDTWRYINFQGDVAGGYAGPSTVQWKIDSTDGTYYDLNGDKEVHLAGVDPISDTTVIHEYTHNIMDNVYTNYPPFPNCNPHTIQGSTSQGCAWSEGFAEFIPSVVNNDPTYRWASGATQDLEGPTWGTGGWSNGDTVEGRVAGALWDIFDSANEGDDQYTEAQDFAPFWDVFYNQDDNTFADFWAAWRSYAYNNTSAGPIMSIYQNTINYRSGPANDDFANANAIAGLPYSHLNLNTTNATTQGNDPNHPCGSIAVPKQSRSVWYQFTPSTSRQYQLQTTGSNYDTVLSVWTGSFGALSNVGCNDDYGGLQSTLFVNLNSGTTYYIEVTQFSSGSGGALYFNIQNSYAPEDIFWYAPGPNADYLARSRGNGSFDYLSKPVGGTYTPLIGNFAGDTTKDIFWYAPGSPPDYLWTATTNGNFSETTQFVSGTYQPFLGDYNADDFTDIFWYAPGPNADYLALSNGNGTFTYLAKPVGGTYTPLVGNFAGNAASDIFWYAPGAPLDYLWTATSAGNFTETQINVSGTYQPLIGDFDLNFFDDIFWYAPGPGADWLALSNGGGVFNYLPKTVGGTYTPLVGNFAGNIGDDIFWYAPGPGGDYLWTATSSGNFSESAHGVSGTYTPFLGDFDFNQFTDIFWYAAGPTADYVAFSNGNNTFTYQSEAIGGTYTPLVGNFDSSIVSSAPSGLTRERLTKEK